ncbi:potassium channel family protein [Acidimicrobiaceae bacterium]|nr:potassium channel family protein [Acidimicrobiaceae bacterium]
MKRIKNLKSLLETLFNSRRLRTILIGLALVIIFFGYIFYITEPTVESIGDGFYWALVTVTTVGYGDITPTTPSGKLIASFLILLGLGLIATITAIVSAKFIQNYVDHHTNDDVLDKLEILQKDIEELKNKIQ